jgi:hypothetical protein
MDQELTKEEIDRRARELARRVMSMPPKPRVKAKTVAPPAREGSRQTEVPPLKGHIKEAT